MQESMWSEIEKYTKEFFKSGLAEVVDFEKFNRIAIVHHSSAMEGSTLTLEETSLLISEGITAKGKPMSEHEMVSDHYKALSFCMEEAAKKTPVISKRLCAQPGSGLFQRRTWTRYFAVSQS